MAFIGREQELSQLQVFAQRKIAGLAVVCGRRRIGKSTLIEHFAKGKNLYEFYGLAPRPGITNKDQLRHFAELLGIRFGIPTVTFNNWNEALSMLATLTANGPAIILLDEISWMAGSDKDFAGKLKGIWDTKFKKNNELILILCGSVTAWIEENILEDKGYVGRISLTLKLQEMSLSDANQFWLGNDLIGATEKFKILCVTGGIPRYLEEIDPKQTAEQNIKRLCFMPEGVLFNEFDKIFKDIFQKRAEAYKLIVQQLADEPCEYNQLAKKLQVEPTGGLSTQIKHLIASGFVARDYAWNNSGEKTKLSHLRLCDNYIRFYLKYIEPKKELIQQGIYKDVALENLSYWSVIMGFQFENLVLNNLPSIINRLSIPAESIIAVGPYFQRETTRQKSCQIDLLIYTKFTLYVCEIKFRKTIKGEIINEIQEKIRRLKYPDSISIRPVLIYQGKLDTVISKSDFFSNKINFSDMLDKKFDAG